MRFFIITRQWPIGNGKGVATTTGHTDQLDDAAAYADAIARSGANGVPANADTLFFFLGNPR